MSRYVDIDKPRYVRYTDERSGEVVTSEQTIADLLDGSIGLIGEEIVRCKDCKYRYESWLYGKRMMICDFINLDYLDCQMGDDGFCSRGRRP